MNNIKKLIFACLLLGCINAQAHAQTQHLDQTQIPNDHYVNFPSSSWRYQIDSSNLERFFLEWEGWSEMLQKGASKSKYNRIFVKRILDKMQKSGYDYKQQYLLLPLRVKVIKYKGKINPNCFENIEYDYFDLAVTKVKKAESISYFTPIIKSNKKVLYYSKDAGEYLRKFIDEPIKDTKDKERYFSYRRLPENIRNNINRRCTMISQYIPIYGSHWGNEWYFYTLPVINTIIIGDDGYYINFDVPDWHGDIFFYPFKGDPESVAEWIQ